MFAQATTNLAGTQLISATLLAQTAMEEAIGSTMPEQERWKVRSNRILWDIERTVEQVKAGVLRVRVVVRRVSDGKIHATMWTEVYQK